MDNNLLEEIEKKYRKKNKILFSRDSTCLQELIEQISRQKHRTLVLWALDCASLPLQKIEARYPGEVCPRRALELCEKWAEGKVKMPVAKKALLEVHAIARRIENEADIALCHAIGQACAVVHVETHAVGLAFYELTAVVREHGIAHCEKPVKEKIRYYRERLLYWEENTDKEQREWAAFLLDDTRANKERLLREKRNCQK